MKKCPKCGREYESANTLCPADGAILEKVEDELLGKTLTNKYRIEERINEGGMGSVYRATHVLMDKTVAVKVLRPSLAADDKIVARFSREAKAASRISHPHALNVTDFGEDENGVVFLVMEYLKGETLKEIIHEDGPMPLPRAVEIIRQVSGALEAAHNEGVVHRDLKSDNIMLIDVGGGDWAKVLDFGIAKIIENVDQDPGLTAPNLIIGTPQYMSPEQCSQAANIDSRSDIYSLGVILYEMLVGHVPFTGESPTAIMMKHLQDPPPSVLEERKDVPAAVGRVVMRAMAKHPEDRYQTVSKLAEALAAAAEGKDVEAAAADAEGSPERQTSRILVPTGANEPPRITAATEEKDEETLVRARESTAEEPEIFADVVPPPAESFKPWRVIVPAAVGLIIVFAVVFALTRNSSSQPAANDNSAPLAVDPNSKPVKPAQTPTGAAEQNIAPNSTPSTREANANLPASVPAEPSRNENARGASSNTRRNENDNSQSSDNSNKRPNEGVYNPGEEQPSPSPSKNSNKRIELPKPNINASPSEPKPLPTPMTLPTPKPSSSGDNQESPAGLGSSP